MSEPLDCYHSLSEGYYTGNVEVGYLYVYVHVSGQVLCTTVRYARQTGGFQQADLY